MAIDELTDKLLTDNDFWSAYKDPELGKLFDKYLIRHNAHPSQKGKPGYNPNNSQWYAEAKKDPNIIKAIKNLKEAKNDSHEQEQGTKAGILTRADYLVRLAATFAGVVLFGGYLI